MEKLSSEGHVGKPQEKRVPFERDKSGEYAEDYLGRIRNEQKIIDEVDRTLPALEAKFKASKSESEKSELWRKMKDLEMKRRQAHIAKEGIIASEGGKNLKKPDEYKYRM